MYCSKCGHELSLNSNFCSNCGMQNMVKSNESSAYGSNASSMMDVKTTSVVAYITWIGFLIAMCAGDKNGAKFYLNQALVYHIFTLACFVPFVGWMWAIFMLVCFILGVIWAAEQKPNELPLIGKLNILS